MRPVVSLVLGRWIVTKSASAISLVEARAARHPSGGHDRPTRTGRRPPAACRTPWPDRPRACRCGRGRRCRASCRRARRPPTGCAPNGPGVSAAWAWGTLRACDSSSAMVCSAAEMMLLCGALTTITPRRVAASTSTLSRPMPARPTTIRSVPASSTSAVTCVAERMMSAWAPTMWVSSVRQVELDVARRGQRRGGGRDRPRRSLR